MLTEEKYLEIADGIDEITERYFQSVEGKGLTQQQLNDAHADFVKERDSYLTQHGTNVDELLDVITARLERKSN